MNCPNCGKVMKKSKKKPDYWWCSDCKKRYKFYDDDEPIKKTPVKTVKKKKNNHLASGIAFCIILFCIFFVYLMSHMKPVVNKDEYDAEMQKIIFSINAQGDTIINIIDKIASEEIDLTAAYTQLGSMDVAISVNQDKIDEMVRTDYSEAVDDLAMCYRLIAQGMRDYMDSQSFSDYEDTFAAISVLETRKTSVDEARETFLAEE